MRKYAVLPSTPTWKLFNKLAACLVIQSTMGSRRSMHTLSLASSPNFNALICPLTCPTALSANPLLCGSYAGGLRGTVMSGDLFFCISACTWTMAGSPSVVRAILVWPIVSMDLTTLVTMYGSPKPLHFTL